MKKTSHGLLRYEDNDPQDLRDGYNRSIDVLERLVSKLEADIKILKLKDTSHGNIIR